MKIGTDSKGICACCGEYVGQPSYGYDVRHTLDECVATLVQKVKALESKVYGQD